MTGRDGEPGLFDRARSRAVGGDVEKVRELGYSLATQHVLAKYEARCARRRRAERLGEFTSHVVTGLLIVGFCVLATLAITAAAVVLWRVIFP